jgi:competence protein ComEA
MSNENLNRLWLGITGLLVLAILGFSLYFALKRDPGEEIKLLPPPVDNYRGRVLVDGAVAQPGYLYLKPGDEVGTLIASSGGLAEDANLDEITLYVPHRSESATVQRVDINHAEAWLLEALPGIGSTKALAIVQYREQNGPFQNIQGIMQVPGISQSIFDKIKDLISVSEP